MQIEQTLGLDYAMQLKDLMSEGLKDMGHIKIRTLSSLPTELSGSLHSLQIV